MNTVTRCLLLCKDRNFKANHNTFPRPATAVKDVCYSAKIGILKQITTLLAKRLVVSRCLLLCKDRNFKANHNQKSFGQASQGDVCYSAKIGILKQITTGVCDIHRDERCLLLCKDRNFKANHDSVNPGN